MRHKRDIEPKKSVVFRFTILTDSMRGIRRNKEFVSVDVTEFTHVG